MACIRIEFCRILKLRFGHCSLSFLKKPSSNFSAGSSDEAARQGLRSNFRRLGERREVKWNLLARLRAPRRVQPDVATGLATSAKLRATLVLGLHEMAALHFLPEAADLLQLWCAHAYFRAATRPRRRRPARLLLARQAFAHARTVLAAPLGRPLRPPCCPQATTRTPLAPS